jgi:nicotinamide riboside kinase
MKDVDILGLSNEGKSILAQVSYSWEPAWKIERLKNYDQKDQTELILFCQTDIPKIINGVIVYPLQRVFDLFQRSEKGKKWMERIR